MGGNLLGFIASFLDGGGEVKTAEEAGAGVKLLCNCLKCFVPGTPILMADGTYKPIEEIHVGDWVMSRDPDTGQTEPKPVVDVISRVTPVLVSVAFADPNTGQVVETLTSTPDHPYATEDGDFTALNGPDLVVASVTWKRDEEHQATVYNMTVDGDHSYFAGVANGGAWVHNSCGNIVADAIANGHAFVKHILDEGQWAGMGIRTRRQFAEFIDNIMQNPSTVRSLARGRTAYWDNATANVVIHNPGAADLGTAFQPANGINYFNGLH